METASDFLQLYFEEITEAVHSIEEGPLLLYFLMVFERIIYYC